MDEDQQQPSLVQAGEQAAAAAPFLFPEFSEADAYESIEAHGVFTGERLFERHPEKYRLICRMVAEGLSTRAVARACAVSPNTVEAVRRREGVTIDAEKEQLLGTIRSGVRLCAERVQELAPEMNARDAAVSFGILAEKMLLLTGEATVIVGKSDAITHEDFNTLLDALPQADAHVVQSSPNGRMDAMGSEARADGQKALAPAPPPGLVDGIIIRGAADGQSPVSPECEASRVTSRVTPEPPNPPTGGGGVAPRARPATPD